MKNYLNSDKISRLNCSYVMEIISKEKEITKKQLCDLSGLSWGGATKIVSKLTANEFVIEEKSKSVKAGRTPCVLKINPKKNYVLGIDINLAGVYFHVMDLAADIKKEYAFNIFETKKDAFLTKVFELTDFVFSEFNASLFSAIGISMQGIIDRNNGVSILFPGIPDWKNVKLKDLFEERYSLSVYTEHDPDCLLYAYSHENELGNTLLFRIDKSIGVSVSIDSEIFRKTGILEISHTIAIPNGKKCSCGKRGCIESYIADCTTPDGSPNKKEISELILPLSITITNLKNIFSAETVIISGDLIRHGALFENELRSKLKLSSELVFWGNNNSASIGACLIAIDETIKRLITD